MKLLSSFVLALFLLVIGFLISTVRDQVFGQNPNSAYSYPSIPQVVVKPPAEPPRWLIDFASVDDPANPARKLRVITVVDPESKRIAVYHVDMTAPATEGNIKLCSVRNIQNDLLLDQHNPMTPTPREVEDSIWRFRKQN